MNKIRFSWKKNLIALITGILIITSGASALTTTITISTLSAAPGSEVNVPIQIEGAQDIGAILLDIRYGTALLEYSGVINGDITAKAVVEGREIKPGLISLGIVESIGLTGSGTLATIRFRVKGNEGSSSSLVPAILESYDQQGTPVSIETNGGTLKIRSTDPTDVNGPAGTIGTETSSTMPPVTRQTPLGWEVPICAGLVTVVLWIAFRGKPR